MTGLFACVKPIWKKETATGLKPAGEDRSAVTDTSLIAASHARSVEEMFQSVNGKNLAEKMKGNKKEAAVGFNPAGEHNSAVTSVQTTTPFAISVEEMLQCVNLENQASSDEIAE